MVRIQLHITSEQDRKLRRLCRKRGESRAELIRRGIDMLIGSEQGNPDPLLRLIGSAGPAGRADVSEHHDDVLYSAGGVADGDEGP